MTPETVMTIAQRALEMTVMLAAPLLLVALLVGLLVGIFQAATQINEMTLSFIPKLIGMATALLIAGPWMLKQLVNYTRMLIESILGRPDLVPEHPRVIVRVKSHLKAHHPAVLLVRRDHQPVERLAHLPLGTGPCRQFHDELHLRRSLFGHGGPFAASITLRCTTRI